MKTYTKLESILKKEPNFLSDDGKLNKWIVIDKARNFDSELIALLLKEQKISELFFVTVNDVLVFNQNHFIQFHSDIRSTKIDIIKKNSNCSLLFYGKKEKIQLRMKVESELHYDDEVTKISWDKTGHISRKCYLVTNGPGTKSEKPTSGLDNKFDNFNFSKEESEEGYKNFCVIKCKVKSIEWLYLAAKGHRRALIELKGSKKFTWLVP